MEKDHNSYSKTDLEATFIRIIDDHMMNGQLKAVCNVQIAVENYFIIHGYISHDRTDYNTLILVITVDANIKPDACTNTILKKMLIQIRF